VKNGMRILPLKAIYIRGLPLYTLDGHSSFSIFSFVTSDGNYFLFIFRWQRAWCLDLNTERKSQPSVENQVTTHFHSTF